MYLQNENYFFTSPRKNILFLFSYKRTDERVILQVQDGGQLFGDLFHDLPYLASGKGFDHYIAAHLGGIVYDKHIAVLSLLKVLHFGT